MFTKIMTALYSFYIFIMTLFEGLGITYLPVTPKIITETAVFDCGENYSVMWSTDVKASGTVYVLKEGRQYVFSDASSGNVRVNDTLHSVKIKKEILDNSYYSVSSQAVSIKMGYSAIKGKTVTGKWTHFDGYHNQEEINAITISDVHEDIDSLKKSLKYFSNEKADLIIMNGDITSTMVTKEKFVEGIVDLAGDISGGEIPVIYIRGNHETRGEYASELKNYFHTDTGELYFRTNYGPVSAICLDYGEDKEDSNEEYSGLVNFDAYREEQYEWLKKQKPDERQDALYRICICHGVTLDNHFGLNWEKEIKRLGTKMTVSGHWHTLRLTNTDGYYSFIDGGESDTNTFIASRIIFKDGNAEIKSVDVDGNVLLNEKIKIS